MLLRARRKEEVEEELTREARKGLGEHLLDVRSAGGKRAYRDDTFKDTQAPG